MAKVKKTTKTTVVSDGWRNLVTGMNTSKDKGTYSTISWTPVSRSQAESFYAGDDIASKIARIIPADGIREKVTFSMDQSENPEEVIKFIEKEFKRLRVWPNLGEGWTLGRVYGGALLYMSISDGRSISQPVNWDRVRKINSLKVIDRHELTHTSEDIISDLSDPKFGTPRVYTYQPSEMVNGAISSKIHNSRVIRFDGVHLPSRLFIQNNHWHDSIYTTLATAIRNYSTNHEAISPIVQAIAQPVYRIQGMSEALAMDRDELILKKLKNVELMRSTVNAIVLDAEDEFTTVAQNVTGAKDLVDMTVQRLVAASDIPHTRLLGQSPSGLGATGESELINYYDSVKAMQGYHLEEALDTLINAIFSQSGAIAKPDDLTYTFNPLFQQTKEAEIKSKMMQAKVDTDYYAMGALQVEEIAQSRFGSGKYSYETTIDKSKERVPGGVQGQADRTASTVGQPTAGLTTGQKSGDEDLANL